MNAVQSCVKSLGRFFGRRRRVRPWDLPSMEEKFTAIFRENTWRNDESISGGGSSLAETEAIREQLPVLLRQIEATSLLDVPCGDFHWMQQVELPIDRYVGADVVDVLVETNRRRYGDDRHAFVKLDLTTSPLPQVDVVLCRDCLVHFSLADVQKALENILASGSRYLLTTTFPEVDHNRDIRTGQWRPLNLQRPPLSLPAPIALIDERCPMKGYEDKSLGLWRIADFAAERR